jgi:uncharacterized protein (DUF1697 family)
MNQYVAFLRAINVAGHAIVKMDDLRDAFTAAGCAGVRTCIQSGNVIFESSAEDAAAVFQRVRARLRSLLGEEPGVSFRTVHDVEKIVRGSPFKSFEAEPGIKLYVAFLSRKPESSPRLPLLQPKEALEAIAIKNLEVFIVSRRKKSGFYGFPNNFIEKELGVSATTRNWSTVTRIVELVRQECLGRPGSDRPIQATARAVTTGSRAPSARRRGRSLGTREKRARTKAPR